MTRDVVLLTRSPMAVMTSRDSSVANLAKKSNAPYARPSTDVGFGGKQKFDIRYGQYRGFHSCLTINVHDFSMTLPVRSRVGVLLRDGEPRRRLW